MWKSLLYIVQLGTMISGAVLAVCWFPVTDRPVICLYLPVRVV